MSYAKLQWPIRDDALPAAEPRWKDVPVAANLKLVATGGRETGFSWFSFQIV